MSLTVSNGTLLLDDVPIRHVGLNVAYLLARRWYISNDTQHIETLDKVAELGIKVIRCFAIPNAAGTGGGLGTWGTTTGLSAAFYTAQDVIFDYAATKGIQIIPCLFPNYWSIGNYKSEKLNQLGVAGSAMRNYLNSCAAEYVAHYASYSSVAAWEISNEWNNYAELNAYPSGNDYTGSAYSADSNNLITIKNLTDAFAEIATTIRSNDANRAILSGNAGPWYTTKNSLDGYEGLFARLNPDPINTISFHIYSYPTNNVWCRQGFAPLDDIVGAAKRVGRNLGKPVILGEIGISENLSTEPEDYETMFNHLKSPNAAPLSLIWNFYKPGSSLPASNDNYDFYTTGARTKYLDSIVDVNNSNPPATVEANTGDIPTKYLVLGGTDAVYTTMPDVGNCFSLSFWTRHDGKVNINFPRIISSTSDESTNGFTITSLGSAGKDFDEPYFRMFNGSGQSATLRSGLIQDLRWKQFTYVFKYWETTFTANSETDILTLAATQTKMSTGDWVRLTTTTTLPGGLATSTDYYVIKETDGTIKLAAGQADAYLGNAINVTDAGTGTHTIKCMSLAVYQNGLKSTGDNTTVFTGTWIPGTGDLVIGANRNKNGDFYRGHVAKVRLWDYGLSEKEVWENYTGKTPISSIDVLCDNLNGLTVVGAPTFVSTQTPVITNKTITAKSIDNNRKIRM